MTQPTDSPAENRLARETSPYLLQHAGNPVDWYPWGEEAFEAARREGKPIFLSVGYSTCYWCHVMEREIFERPEMAVLMNRWFINVKVDREERPDVDDVYMTAVQAMTRRGGWPMSVFLTPPGAEGEGDPGLKPFWGATYLPPEPAQGMPSFPQVAEGLSKAWSDQREEVLEQARQLAGMIRGQYAGGSESGKLDASVVQSVVDQMLTQADGRYGGFGGSPKFPQASLIGFEMTVASATGNEELLAHVHQTLDRMARGGLYDQIGGGFHRYSVDEKWLVPHFEKMLYDNGQLLALYGDALALSPDHPSASLYALVVRETAGYLLREMTDASGAFWSAQDAEVDAREGGNYLWRREELEGVFEDGALRGFAERVYGLDLGPNFQDPHHPEDEPANVLCLPYQFDEVAQREGLTEAAFLERLGEARRVMLVERMGREQPSTDDKVLASWNGMAIVGLARCARVLGDEGMLDMARRGMEAVLRELGDGAGGLYRSMRGGRKQIAGYLDDYAFVIAGLLELERALPGEGGYLAEARRLVDEVEKRFAAEGGGYFDSPAGAVGMFVRTRVRQDGAVPSGNAQMAHNLLDLYEITGEGVYFERVLSLLGGFAASLGQIGMVMVHMQHALLRAIGHDAERVAAAGGGGDEPVRVSAERDGEGYQLRFEIAAGYYVQAPEQGVRLAGVKPVAVGVRGDSGYEVEADWPEGVGKQTALSGASLTVYEGRVEVPVRLTGEGVLPELEVVVQACTEGACLEPRVMRVVLADGATG
ncbi:DUF255 domain-containing protein [Mucisphaera calidilacus]|uniref:DUF255 domain-containing protein n=1 Tax=Mucisphaera calidilacus TaxID=2527982 RepID=A0A518BYR8_9BACT|nr:DUF255 domain-containing protein [Mucisphaera calidilacus]QDU72117.1 hypothetical protein Pan265_19790 [Mucisphaera calidilacus]